MKAEEIYCREYMTRLGKLPRKYKKSVKIAIKKFIKASIECDNWELYDSLTFTFDN